jgi:hypothetical protein
VYLVLELRINSCGMDRDHGLLSVSLFVDRRRIRPRPDGAAAGLRRAISAAIPTFTPPVHRIPTVAATADA